LYHRLPNWKEAVCILIHDWGYWGKPNIDGIEGERHPAWAAAWAYKHFDYSRKGIHFSFKYRDLCAGHSVSFARKYYYPISRLCLPDKVGVALMPIPLMVLLGKLTGETREYRSCPKYAHTDYEKITDGEYYQALRDYYREIVIPGLKVVEDGKG
jgi:hypothetical protein